MSPWVTWSRLGQWRDVGLLIVRIGVGLSFVGHGWPKVTGGPEKWTRLGGAMADLGVTFAPTFWGAAAAFGEVIGGVLLALGLATRPAAAVLAVTMFVAWASHMVEREAFRDWSHSFEAMCLFVALVLVGPGKWSVDRG